MNDARLVTLYFTGNTITYLIRQRNEEAEKEALRRIIRERHQNGCTVYAHSDSFEFMNDHLVAWRITGPDQSETEQMKAAMSEVLRGNRRTDGDEWKGGDDA